MSAALAAGACAHAPAPQLRAHITPEAELTLPLPPAYPNERVIQQSVEAHYGERHAAFEAIVSLAPDAVDIVVTAAGGPRLATIHWTNDGVSAERALLAPGEIPAENILSDIFISLWPEAAVRHALPDDCVLETGEGPARSVSCGGQDVMAISPDPERDGAVIVRNNAFGYELHIVGRDLQ